MRRGGEDAVKALFRGETSPAPCTATAAQGVVQGKVEGAAQGAVQGTAIEGAAAAKHAPHSNAPHSTPSIEDIGSLSVRPPYESQPRRNRGAIEA